MKSKVKALSKAEQRRLANFEAISEEMKRQGYTQRDLTINMSKANLFAVSLFVLLLIVGAGLYYLVHRSVDFTGYSLVVFLVAVAVLSVAHELIHGLSWSRFTPHRFKDIEFGIQKTTITPYCTCLVPLKKQHYLIGAAMPLVVLGIIPMIVGIAIGNSNVVFMGTVMAASAAGDILIMKSLIGYKSSAGEIVYMDHPTEAGSVVFEK